MQITNAIAWGHVQLKGGWKNILVAGAAYLGIIGGLIVVSLRLEPNSSARILASWTMGLMGLQIGILLLYGCYVISAAVRKDVSARMIESHRLMPVSGTDAVAGYILGPSCQAISMALVNLVLGLIITPWAGLSSMAWLKANFVLGVFAFCCWISVVFLTLVMPVGSRVLMGFVWILVIGHRNIAPLMPGLSILAGPALGESVFGVIISNRIPHEFYISMPAQVLVAMLCYVGAARRYRRDDVLAWGPMLGLTVLATYVAITITGLSLWEIMMPRLLRMERIPFELQLILAAVGALWAAVLPVSAVAWLHAGYERRRALHDPAPNPRPAPISLVVLAAALITAAVMPLAVQARWHVCTHTLVQTARVHMPVPSVGADISTDTIVRTILVALAFLTFVNYVLRAMYRRGSRSAAAIVLLSVLFTWAGPPLVDFLIQQALTGFGAETPLTALAGCSPLVVLSSLWANVGPMSTTPGIAAQCLLAALLAAIYHLAKPLPRTQTLPGPG